jgi:CheY-like chemotaxis protein
MPRGGQLTIETANVELDDEYVSRHPGTSVGPHVMLAVSDTGEGMDDATQRRVFEPFFTTKAVGKGTGLGLATVYGIVKQSRGSIWLYSEPRHGSTFKIYLPAVMGGETREILDDQPLPTPAGPTTILVVEDQADVRTVIQAVLSRRGYTVLVAANGQEALALSREHVGQIHLLFTDVVMPGMSGRQVAQVLTAERPGLRVLYTSGYTDDTIVHHGVLDPGLAFIQKPFTAAALVRKIRDILEAAQPPAV